MRSTLTGFEDVHGYELSGMTKDVRAEVGAHPPAFSLLLQRVSPLCAGGGA